jgi:hypothetical protein
VETAAVHCAIYASPKWRAYLKTNQTRCIGIGHRAMSDLKFQLRLTLSEEAA